MKDVDLYFLQNKDQHLSTKTLITRLTKIAFKIIYDQFFEGIRRYVFYRSGNAELATDIAQETFMKVWEKQLYLKPEKLKGLLYKIAGDLFISHLRRQNVAGDYLEEISFSFKEAYVDEALELEEIKRSYEKVLAGLPEKQRLVFLMSRMEELTYKEIAVRLDISVKAVEKRMSLALAELRKEIQQ